MRDNPIFRKFVKRRAAQLSRYDALRAQIDSWIEDKADEPTLADMALFRGLLLERARVFSEILANDEEIFEHLLPGGTGGPDR